jgi:hypothetical protein
MVVNDRGLQAPAHRLPQRPAAPAKPLVDLTFKNSEQLGQTDLDRKAIYAIYCENERGEKFIVVLQKANGPPLRQNYFKDRTVYYSTFPIREQAEKGEWDYRLKAVYCVGILDFTFNDYATATEAGEVVHTVQLKNQHGRVFYDKLTYLYIEMPHFKLREDGLRTRLDKLMLLKKCPVRFIDWHNVVGAAYCDDFAKGIIHQPTGFQYPCLRVKPGLFRPRDRCQCEKTRCGDHKASFYSHAE